MARQPKQNNDLLYKLLNMAKISRRIKLYNDFTFILKLNKEDRKKLDEIQLSGINASNLFREFIRKFHKDNNIKPTND